MTALPLQLDTGASPDGGEARGKASAAALAPLAVSKMRRCLPGTFDEAVTRPNPGPSPVATRRSWASSCLETEANNAQQSWGFEGNRQRRLQGIVGPEMGLYEDASFNCN